MYVVRRAAEGLVRQKRGVNRSQARRAVCEGIVQARLFDAGNEFANIKLAFSEVCLRML